MNIGHKNILLDLKIFILILDFVSVVAVAERVGSGHVILISDRIGQMAQEVRTTQESRRITCGRMGKMLISKGSMVAHWCVICFQI